MACDPCQACSDSCVDKDGITGVAVCTFHDKGGDPDIFDDPDDHYHNYCDTTGVDLFASGVSTADDRPVVQCGCCDESLGLENIKMSKKGAHCVYDEVTMRRERELAVNDVSAPGNVNHVRRQVTEEDY